MNKQCIVRKDVGHKHGNIGLRFESIDHFGTMEGAIMCWDPFWDPFGEMSELMLRQNVEREIKP